MIIAHQCLDERIVAEPSRQLNGVGGGGCYIIPQIRLLSADIGGDIYFNDANIENKNGKILSADGVKIAGSIFCRKEFYIIGDANFTAATIEKWFDWKPVKWHGILNLSHASAGQWIDNWQGDGWKHKGAAIDGASKLNINTFSYSAFGGDHTDPNAQSRVAWIRKSQEGKQFVPGPYETLAKVLRAAGDEDGANEVGYAKCQDRAKSRKGELRHFISDSILSALVGHGYKPWRGLYWLAAFFVFGFYVFSYSAPLDDNIAASGIIKPAIPTIFKEKISICKVNTKYYNDDCPENEIIDINKKLKTHGVYYSTPNEYTPFSPFWYSLDTLIPLVDLGQEGAWSPSPIEGSPLEDPWGWAVLIYLYIHIIMGWVLTTLTVVALTGVIKKD
jgi:hypothetical protein